MLAKHTRSVSLPPRKIYSHLPPVRMLWDYERRVYTASHVNVARFILDKAVDMFRLESKNTGDTYGWHKQKNQQ
jgi:hypothetical protein